jgi:hypothetical protein
MSALFAASARVRKNGVLFARGEARRSEGDTYAVKQLH